MADRLDEFAERLSSQPCEPTDLLRLRSLSHQDFEKVLFWMRAARAEDDLLASILRGR
jgi:hypothetical protein